MKNQESAIPKIVSILWWVLVGWTLKLYFCDTEYSVFMGILSIVGIFIWLVLYFTDLGGSNDQE